MSTLVSKNVQVGTSVTATDNFTIFQPATPDGTLRIGNGNTGITTSLVALTSGGNFGVGTSSPTAKLHIFGPNAASTNYTNGDATGATLLLQDSIGNPNNGGQILFAAAQGIFAGIKGSLQNGTGPAGDLIFQTRSTSGNVNERARIDYLGNLLVGTTSGTGGRIVSEANGFNESSANAWKNGAFNGRGSFGGPLALVNTGGASDGFAFYLTGSPSQLNIRFGANGGAVSAGVFMTSTATSWSAQSDERLKDITGTITDAVQSVQSLRPVRYTFKTDQDKTTRVGLIAQDVQKVLPEIVDVDDKGYLGVRYSEVVPLLVAAIQELKAEFDAYKATHP